MKNLKNFKIYKKLKKKSKLIIGIGMFALSGITITSFIITNKDKKEVITEYYGEDSDEKKILDYIDISESLNRLNLDNYENIERSNYNISNELMSVKDLNDLIIEFKGINVSSKNIESVMQIIELFGKLL